MRSRSGLQNVRRAVAGAALLTALLAGTAVPVASATQAHYFAGTSFGVQGSAAGGLALRAPDLAASPRVGGSSLAVDEASGDVYVADTENHRVSEFDSSGGFISAFGWGVSDGAAEPQTCSLVCQAGLPGSAPGQLEAPVFVAVDNSPGGEGDVYVGDSADATVTKFTAGGALVGSWAEGGQLKSAPSSPSFDPLGGIAVDAGRLLVFAKPGARVLRFERSGAFVSELTNETGLAPSGLAVDAASDLYLADGRASVFELSSTGVSLGRLTQAKEAGRGALVTGIAASLADGALYADEEGAALGAYASGCPRETAGTTNESFCRPFQRFGEGRLDSGAGLAVDSGSGTLYAASTADDQIVAFPVAIEASTLAADDTTASAATLHGTVDPRGSELSLCRFEYGEGGAEGQLSVPCAEGPAEIGAGNSPVSVHADVSGLEGATSYRFRLRATNAHGDVKAAEEGFTTQGSPGIGGVEATGLQAGSATLRAEIDPRASETSFHFEWGPCTGGCAGAPYPNSTPQGTIAAASSAAPVARLISGLGSQTTYHFRIVATNALGTTTSPEHTFIEEPSAPIEGGCANEALRQVNGSTALPDCRAYELVTPAEKNGSLIGGVLFGIRVPRIGPDGSSLISPAVQCLAATPSCIAHRGSEGELYDFARSAAGWQTVPLAPSATALQTHTWLSTAAGSGQTLIAGPAPISGLETLYVRETQGALRAIGPLGDKPTASGVLPGFEAMTHTVQSTGDFSRIVYAMNRPAWTFDPGEPETPSLYEYGPTSGEEPELVGVSGGPGSRDLISVCGTTIGGVWGGASAGQYNSLSADGRIVWFTALQCAGGSGTNAAVPVPADQLYARIDGARTLHISASTPATCATVACQTSSPAAAVFEGATPDGSLALFSSTQMLSDEASEDSAPDDSAAKGCQHNSPSSSGCNLYASLCPTRCEDPAQRRLIDVSAGGAQTGGPKVQGVVAVAPNGSRVYFVAKGVLTQTPDALGAEAHEGADNLYLYEPGAGTRPSLRFVTGLAAGDRELWLGGAQVESGEVQGLGVANITPDGRYLVFPSRARLTPDAGQSRGAAQIYRLDATDDQLTRISVGQQGFADDGDAGLPGADATIVGASNAFVSGNGPATANPTVSGEGRYVFFQSPLALTPGALDQVVVEEPPNNAPVYAQNIYEWEEDGAGGCAETRGCVSLLSDGHEAIGAGKIPLLSPELLGADPSGKDVFIGAIDPLTWQDTDTQRDFYDLRVEGGFAPPAEAPPCAGDACRGAGTAAAPSPVTATSTAVGPEEGPRHPRHHKRKKHHRKHRKHHGKQKGHHKKHQGKPRGHRGPRADDSNGGKR
jgi:DNA-binding beta-propeller fold protein YncE